MRDKAKFPQEQAEETASAIAESFAEWQGTLNVATREDAQRIEAKVEKVETEIDRLEDAAKSEIALLRSEARESGLRVTIRLGGMIIAAVGVLAAIKYFG